MKTVCLFLALVVAGFAAVDVNKPIPELNLRDGRVLKNVEIVTFNATSVGARWEGGRGTINYDQFPEEWQKALEPMRPRKPDLSPIPTPTKTRKTAAPIPPGVATRTITGQIFVTTRGAGAYKFAGVSIRAFPVEILEAAAATQRSSLPAGFKTYTGANKEITIQLAWERGLKPYAPVAESETDADGRYKLTIPTDRDHFLVCYASRSPGSGFEVNTWVMMCPSTLSELNLNSGNEWRQPTPN